jgi:hypothetical protein
LARTGRPASLAAPPQDARRSGGSIAHRPPAPPSRAYPRVIGRRRGVRQNDFHRIEFAEPPFMQPKGLDARPEYIVLAWRGYA